MRNSVQPVHRRRAPASSRRPPRGALWGRIAAVGALSFGCMASGGAETRQATAPRREPAPPAPDSPPPVTSAVASPSIHALTVERLDGTETALSSYAGQVLLIVNTASKCGHTPQYEGLQALHAKYSPRGFAVLGFPSNDFAGQEPGTAHEIASFCTSIYGVNFPMFEKTKTIGAGRSPLYALLAEARGEPKWNFHKYLVDKHGRPVQAWASAVQPGSPEIANAIEAQLAVE